MRPTIKIRILAVIAALLLGIGILRCFFVFTDFMAHTIYEESTAHLTEIYHQANQTLYNKVSLNWGVMRSVCSAPPREIRTSTTSPGRCATAMGMSRNTCIGRPSIDRI